MDPALLPPSASPWTSLIGPAVVAAVISGLVSTIGILISARAAQRAHTEKLTADRELAEQKLLADKALALSEKAWADYELRRDVYFDFARCVSSLFENGDPAGRPELHQVARKIRLVGSDRVVKALNAFTAAIRDKKSSDITGQRYRALFNAMRQDIRQIRALPPEGTDLGEDAFPIEG